MRRLVLGAVMALASAAAQADECADRVKLHGLLTRAYAQCPLSYYAKGFAATAELCRDKIGDTKFKALFADGAQAFDARAKEQGKEKFCTKLVGDFAYTVRR